MRKSACIMPASRDQLNKPRTFCSNTTMPVRLLLSFSCQISFIKGNVNRAKVRAGKYVQKILKVRKYFINSQPLPASQPSPPSAQSAPTASPQRGWCQHRQALQMWQGLRPKDRQQEPSSGGQTPAMGVSNNQHRRDFQIPDNKCMSSFCNPPEKRHMDSKGHLLTQI